MGMKMLIDAANKIEDGVWLASIAPHELQLLGTPIISQGIRSIVLTEGGDFDESTGTLQVDAAGITVLNLGTSRLALIVNSANDANVSEQSKSKEFSAEALGPGDKEFVQLVRDQLRGDAQVAALNILQEVRNVYPGDLKRGQRSNFKNTPDNFWYVIVQPRVQSLSITVRGHVERFHSELLELKADRPGYTRFALSTPSQVAEAFRVIEQSKKK